MARQTQDTKAITITIPRKLLVEIDKHRGDITRSKYCTKLLELGRAEKNRFNDVMENAKGSK